MKREKELTVILGIIVLVFVMSFFIFRLAHLKEPVFLPHAYVFTAEDSSQVGFYYITNDDEKRRPVKVTCPELGENAVFPVMHTEQWQGHSMYTWNEMWVNFDFWEEVDDLSSVILTQMHVQWSDGTEMPVDIGEVRFLEKEAKRSLQWTEMELRDNDAYYTMEIPEELTVKGVHIPMRSHFSDLLTVEDEAGQPLTFPAVYEKGDTLTLRTSISLTEKDHRAHMVIDVVPVLEMETAKGEKVCAYLYDSLRYTPEKNILEIYRILHMKGDI